MSKKNVKTRSKKSSEDKAEIVKNPSKKKGSKKSSSPKPSTQKAKKDQSLLTIFILLLVVFALAFIAHIFFKPDQHLSETKKGLYTASPSDKKPSVKKPVSSSDKKKLKAPFLEKADKKAPEELERIKEKSLKPLEKLPEIAIIIDDIGYDSVIAEAFMDLNIPLSFAILPYSPHAEHIAKKAFARSYELILHLPMEPENYPKVDPGEGALLVSMEADKLREKFELAFKSLPWVKGVNNHMGSLFTSSEAHINQLFLLLKKHDLYFIDSKTTKKSICRSSARMFKLPFGERDVFIDHIQEEDAIDKALEELMNKALKDGRAIGIAHPYWLSLKGMKKILPEAEKKFKFVYASELTAIVQ